jgi:hypothetical protein
MFFGGAYMFFGGAYDHYLRGTKKYLTKITKKEA